MNDSDLYDVKRASTSDEERPVGSRLLDDPKRTAMLREVLMLIYRTAMDAKGKH